MRDSHQPRLRTVRNTLPGLYLEEAVHIGLHVGDGHPLHDDSRDAPLQSLPLIARHPGGVNTNGAPVGRSAHTAWVNTTDHLLSTLRDDVKVQGNVSQNQKGKQEQMPATMTHLCGGFGGFSLFVHLYWLTECRWELCSRWSTGVQMEEVCAGSPGLLLGGWPFWPPFPRWAWPASSELSPGTNRKG